MVDSEVAVASGSGDLTVILPDSVDHTSEIASLKEQLALQDIVRCSFISMAIGLFSRACSDPSKTQGSSCSTSTISDLSNMSRSYA